MRKRVGLLLAIIGVLMLIGIILRGFQWFLPAAAPTIRYVGTRSAGSGKELVIEVTNDSSYSWNYAGLLSSGMPFCNVQLDSRNSEGVPAGILSPGLFDRINLAPRSSIRWSIPLPAEPVHQVRIGMSCYRGSAREFRLLQMFRPDWNRPIRFFDGRQRVFFRLTVDETGQSSVSRFER